MLCTLFVYDVHGFEAVGSRCFQIYGVTVVIKIDALLWLNS